ncbi:hypothetical protein NLX83_21635 [Allokutzneria sp. A3M-2-11 16]|uniref:hypothetical protein n=1 Tax=Allokutzneria sp. A3M-2-11 16 TaxID=2962043 RepID=UPI0020B81277|nr:hypothetical protein [Allokutzneria sp. A3M-2-11 16]MCP3801872.1 hypothetical protein [Allokutzneria sp. A3M-2-11 16]
MAVERYAELCDPRGFIAPHVWVQNEMGISVPSTACAETISVDYRPPNAAKDELSLTYQPFAFFTALKVMNTAGTAWLAQHGSPEQAHEKWPNSPYESSHARLARIRELDVLSPAHRRLLDDIATAADNSLGPVGLNHVVPLARALIRCAKEDTRHTSGYVPANTDADGPE